MYSFRLRVNSQSQSKFHGDHVKPFPQIGKYTILCLLFITVIFQMLCCVSAHNITTSLSPSSSNQTTPRTPVTISPAVKVKYTLQLYNSGPAVLDSMIKFYVELIPHNHSTDNWSPSFIYLWMNMADMEVYQTQGGLHSMISIIFKSDTVSAGEYPMTVAVFFKDDQTKLVAFQTKKFTLTNKLNGQLSVQQDLVYQRYPLKVFATKTSTYFQAYVLDQFPEKQDVTFKYKWFENNTNVKNSKKPLYTTSFLYPTNMTFTSEVLAKVSDITDLPQNTHLSKPVNSAYTDATSIQELTELMRFQRNSKTFAKSGAVGNPGTQNTIGKLTKRYNKDGNFTASLLFKDPLHYCEAQRVNGHPKDKDVATGSSLVINVTCVGSSPSSICWNSSALNKSDINPCKPATFLPTTNHQIILTLNKTGWIKLHFFIYNDVSRIHINQSFYAYSPGSGVSEALYLPVVFGVLGIIIILLGVAYIMRLRKKPQVEVADFDFHPSLTSSMESNNSIRISRMVNALKYLLFVKSKNVTKADEAKNYSSFSSTPLTESTESAKVQAFYGSL